MVHVNFILFADDTSTVVKCNDINNLIPMAIHIVNIINTLMNNNNLVLNKEKKINFLFKTKQSLLQNVHVKLIEGSLIKSVHQF